jgi:diguanylate cyclase (GGDEF)-like protein/PAS domain S-box-containing protein
VAGLYEYSYTNIVLTILAILLTLVIAGFAWIRRRINGAHHLIALSLIGTTWGIIYLVELLTKPVPIKLLLNDIQYVPVSFLAPVFFLLTLVFTSKAHRIRQLEMLLYVIPVLTVVFIATRDFHQLIRLHTGQIGASSTTQTYAHGPWYWIVIGSSLAFMVVSVVMLFRAYLRAPRWSRGRTGGLLLASVIITGAAVLSLPAWISNIEINLTLVALLMALSFLAYSLLSARMLEVIPLAASTLLSQVSDAVITLNAQGEIIDYNSSARAITHLALAEHIGECFPDLLKNQLGFELTAGWETDHSEEINMGEGAEARTFDMRISPLVGDDRKIIGSLVVLREITQRKQEEIERVHIQERYRAILQNANYAILLLDEEGRIKECNQQFARLSGYANGELHGRLLQELVPALSPLTETNRDKLLPTQEVTLRISDGDLIPTDVNIIPIGGEEEPYYFVTLQDIRERKKNQDLVNDALANVQSRVNDLAILRNVTESLNQATSLRNAILPVIETVRQVTNSSNIWCFILGKTPDSFQRIEYHPLSENNMLVIENQAGIPPVCLTKLMEGGITSPRLINGCPCSTLTGERRHRAFPLYVMKQPLGVLNFIENSQSPINDNKERLLQTICGSLAVAIDRVRLFKSEYDQRKLAETFRDIGSALTTSLDINEVHDLLLDQLSRVIPYDGASVMVLKDGCANITRTRGYELSKKKHLAEVKNHTFDIETTTQLKKMVLTMAPLILNDTHIEDSFVPTAVSADYHSWLGAPVIIDNKTAAIFILDKEEVGFYNEEHARLLSSFAAQASLTIRNATLFSQEQNRIKQLDGLRATLTAISAQLDVQVLLKEVLKRAVGLLNAEFGELALYDPDQDLLRVIASENMKPETVGVEVRRGEGLMGEVARTRKPYAVPNYSTWPGRIPEYEKYNLNSLMAVPMLGAEKDLLGVIGVGHSRKDYTPSEDEMRLLNLFAQQATVALRNARLYEEARRRAEEAETIRKAGAVVVSSLTQDKTISLILEQLSHVVPYDSASVLLYTKGKLQIVGGHGFNDINSVIGLEFSLDRDNPGARVFLDNKPQMIGDIPAEVPHFNQVHLTNKLIVSWMGVPLKIQNQPIGILSLDGHTANLFTSEHERLVTAFADQVAIALENARLYEGALQNASRFETLYKLSQVISANVRSELIYPAIHEATSELMETEFFSISLVNENAGLIEDVYMVDRGEPVALSSRPLGQGLFGRVLETGHSLLYNTFSDDMIAESGAVLIGDPAEDEISQSVLVVPLKIGSRLVGVVSAQSYKPYAYTDTDVELLELLGANAAIAIENARLFSEVQELAVTDPLTGLYNRRKLIELGESEFVRSSRYERDLSAIMLDCDGFKRVNDTFGHTVGDQVLIRLGEISLASIRNADILARYGGDEFMILLPETGIEAALVVAERLREDVIRAPFATNAGNLPFSVSVGVASLEKGVHSLGQLLDRADFASYVSKDTGGNRVTRWTASLARKHKPPGASN